MSPTDRRIAVELTSPQFVAEHRGKRPTHLILFGREGAAESGPNAEHVEKLLRDGHGPDELGAVARHQVDPGWIAPRGYWTDLHVVAKEEIAETGLASSNALPVSPDELHDAI